MNKADPLLVKNSQTIIIIYSFNCFINFIGILMNIGLIIITIKNKTLQSTCHLLIACCALFTIFLLIGMFITYTIVIIPSIGSISILSCFYIQLIPVFGTYNVVSLITCIGLDRALSVFFPVWYNFRSKRLAFLLLFALSTLLPLYIIWIIIQNILKDNSQQVVCTLGELFGEKTSYVASLSFIFVLCSVFCYILVWIKLKKDIKNSNNNNNIESIKSRQPIFHSLIIIMLIQVCGWTISHLAFYLIFSFVMDPLMQWIFASIFSCLVCASASTDPIVLFCTR